MEDISAVTQQSAATTDELASLTMTQTNATLSLMDMVGMLNDHSSYLAEQNKSLGIAGSDKIIQKKRIAFIFCQEHHFWNPTKESAKSAAKKYNVEVEFYSPEKMDAGEQLELIKNAIDNGFDAMAVSPNGGQEITDTIKEAVKDGIYVICFDSDDPNCGRLASMGTDGYKGGQAAGKVAAKILSEKGTVLIDGQSDQNIKTLSDRKNGFIDAIKTFPEIKLKQALIPTDPSDDEADRHIARILEDNPDVDLFYTTNLVWGLHFGRYFKRHNPGKILITFDCSKDVANYIQEGVIHTAISQRHFVWGELSVKWLVDAMNGKEIPEYEDTGTYEVNKFNYMVFEKRFS